MWFWFELNWLVKKSWTIKLLYKVTLYYYFSWGIKFLIFWTSYSYKQFVLFPHMVSQEQVLKPNVGLSEHSNSELFCANNTISSDLETFYIKTFLVTFLRWSSSLRKSWLTKIYWCAKITSFWHQTFIELLTKAKGLEPGMMRYFIPPSTPYPCCIHREALDRIPER